MKFKKIDMSYVKKRRRVRKNSKPKKEKICIEDHMCRADTEFTPSKIVWGKTDKVYWPGKL